MAGETNMTISGNLVDDPVLRYTSSGAAVANFRVASTPRYKDQDGNWKDGDALFLSVNVWRQHAENVAESLVKGQRVIVSGRLRQRSYEAQDGSKRTVFELEADDVGPSLRNATAKVNRTGRSRGEAEDPWAGGSSDSGGRRQGHVTGTGEVFPDEPPF
jgi:single-strand DNA-binding protein